MKEGRRLDFKRDKGKKAEKKTEKLVRSTEIGGKMKTDRRRKEENKSQKIRKSRT